MHGVETSEIECDSFQVNIVVYAIPNPKTLAFIYADRTNIHKENVKKVIFSWNMTILKLQNQLLI